MTGYTDGTLDKSSKKRTYWNHFTTKNKVEKYTNVNTDALEEIRKFNENFVELEFKIDIVKRVNILPNKRVTDMERQC